MKLSEKGIKRFNHLYWEEDEQLHEIEFEPDDFKDMIMFTVKEVKEIKTFLDDAVELHDKGIVVIQSTGFNTIQLIKERIKQIEMSKQST